MRAGFRVHECVSASAYSHRSNYDYGDENVVGNAFGRDIARLEDRLADDGERAINRKRNARAFRFDVIIPCNYTATLEINRSRTRDSSPACYRKIRTSVYEDLADATIKLIIVSLLRVHYRARGALRRCASIMASAVIVYRESH